MNRMAPGRVVLDLRGRTLGADDRRRLMHPGTAGVILFARNFSSRAQLRALTEEIHALRSPPLVIAVDHEGGRVQRFRRGFTALPPMAALGRAWNEDPLAATRAATATGYVLAAELLECGVDLSFTPVLDLDHGPSGVIGDRAFHRDPRVVTLLAKSLMQGMLAAGMRNCGKHFPGHGYAAADSHLEVPVDERELDALLADDAAPYGWLAGPALAAIMPAHVIYPRVDARPAGFSRRWLRDILRGR
ncbi:MAG: beta-N-acetylhexosaminidase, partial [Burkholderiales bacterium]